MSGSSQNINHTIEKLQSGNGKILVIQTAFLGDVILITPLLRAIRKSFPKAVLSIVVIPECSSVLHNQVDEIIEFDKRDRRMVKENWKRLIKRIREGNFELALVPHRSFRSGLTAYKAGIPTRIGFSRGAGSIFNSHRVEYRRNMYEGQRNLKLLELIAPVDDTGIPELFPCEEDNENAVRALTELNLKTGKFAVFAPGSVWKSKQWLPDYYDRLRTFLEQDYSIPVVALGGMQDSDICAQVVSRAERNLAGKTTPLGSASIMAQAQFTISGDSAPAHIATAMETKQVIIFGSTHPRFGFAPPVKSARIVQIQKWCRPCSDHGRNYCPNVGSYDCLRDIKPENIIKVIRDWLE